MKSKRVPSLGEGRHRFGNPVRAAGRYANDTDERYDQLIRSQSRLQAGANQRRCAERKGLYARDLSSTNWSRKQSARADMCAKGWGWPSRFQDPPQRTRQGKFRSRSKGWCHPLALDPQNSPT